MDFSASSNHPLHAGVKADDNPAITDDEKIKPMILLLDEKIKVKQDGLIREPSDQYLHLGAKINALSVELDHKETGQSGVSAQAEELWPKASEFDDCPPSPNSENVSIKQVISESAYAPPKQTKPMDDRQSTSPSVVADESISKMEKIGKPAYQSEQDSWPSSPASKPATKPRAIRQSISDPNLHATEAMLDELSLNSTTASDRYNPAGHMLRDPGYQSPAHDYRRSAKPRLSCVLEESESFSRREFGDDALSYMSTFSSANHATSILSSQGYNRSDLSSKHASYRHNNYHNFAYDLNPSSYGAHRPGGFKSSKSAPAGTATRTGSAFGLFRRASSETSGLRLGRRTVYRPRGARKPKTLASTILWPLVKIKNGYVGCMMGLDGTGDLSAMAQGGSYATAARYFTDAPLSKMDSRNYG